METLNTKALRVLTGVHAGARIALAPGLHRIGAEPDADIGISDWTAGPLTLSLDDAGVARLDAGTGDTVLLADFVAVPYGDVVFCLGPDDGPWPSDLALLAGLWKTAPLVREDADAQTGDAAAAPQPAARPVQRRLSSRTAVMALAGTAAIGALAISGTLLAGTQSSEAANVRIDDGALAGQLSAALHQAGITGLTVDRKKELLIISGIVTNSAEAARARRIADTLAPARIRRDYDVAEDDADEIRQSLSGTGATVAYAGNGVFRIGGRVASLAAFRERLASVRADLDHNVRSLDVTASESAPASAEAGYAEVVATGDVRYLETPDGIKHLVGNGPNETNVNH